jgi:uncharacterized membrane protein
MVLVQESEVHRLSMSVAEGIKYIISLGAIGPDQPPLRSSRESLAHRS